MKNTIKLWLIGGMIFLILVITGCDNGGGSRTTGGQTQDVAKAQSATINFGTDLSATVQGTFTDTEWQSIPVAIRTALQSSYDDGWNFTFGAVFENGRTIIVEKTSSYKEYSTTHNGQIIHINFAVLNGGDLEVMLQRAVAANVTGDDLIVKATPSHDKGWKEYGKATTKAGKYIKGDSHHT